MERSFRDTWLFRYGFLALVVMLTLASLRLLPAALSSGTPAPFTQVFINLSLLLGHVAGFVIPRGRLSNWLGWLSLAWTMFTVVYVFSAGFSDYPFN